MNIWKRRKVKFALDNKLLTGLVVGKPDIILNFFRLKRFSCSVPNQSQVESKPQLDPTLLEKAITEMYNEKMTVPIVVGGKRISSGDEQKQRMPHKHSQAIIKFCYANKEHINICIRDMMIKAKMWNEVLAVDRAQIWRKCADQLETEDRYRLHAAIMIGQGKTSAQAEEDTHHLLYTLRANADFIERLAKAKPKKDRKDVNPYARFVLRPLDGFVAAIGPFTHTYVSANLALCPALMGNCVLWKPSDNCVLSSYIIWKAIRKSGLPRGVINFMPSNGKLFVNTIVKSPVLGGINFTGKITNFREIWHSASVNLRYFKSMPRIVGECGGKNFHFVHESADAEAVADATIHAAFSYSGQCCRSCSRLYVPQCMWEHIKCLLEEKLSDIKIGDPCDFSTYSSAVINESAFDRIVEYIKYAIESANTEIIHGGNHNKTVGYFIEPTVVRCKDPFDRLMTDDINGPFLSIFVYKAEELDSVLEIIPKSSLYAFTGSIFASDGAIIKQALHKLSMAASNLYVNEKCTGATKSQLPLAGTRYSGTNDHGNTPFHLMRWSAPQLIEKSSQ